MSLFISMSQKTMNFVTKVGGLWLFVQNITCNYDLSNGTAQKVI